MSKINVALIIALIFINALAHFMPPERASLAPDSYVRLAMSKGMPSSLIFYNSFRVIDRPLNYLSDLLGAKIIKDRPIPAFLLLFLTNSALLLVIFLLFKALLKEEYVAFFAALIFCLMPHKLEIYHNSVFTNLNMAMIAAVSSFYFFVRFSQMHKSGYLVASVCAYAINLFWYPVAFFLPIAIVFYCRLFKKEAIKYAWFFFLTAIIFVTCQFTNFFGLAYIDFACYSKSLSGFALPIVPVVDLFHHYFGRYILRNVIYGMYMFFSIEQPWFTLIAALDLILFFVLFKIIKVRHGFRQIDKRLLVFSVVIFFSFLLPFLLNSKGGIASRYLTLPSIGLAILFACLFDGFMDSRARKAGVVVLILMLVVISQGNAWSQVVASRINSAVYQTLKKNITSLSKSESVVLDVSSLADNIKFSLIKREDNLLDTYFGALTFHIAGFKGMVTYLTDDTKSVYIASKKPEFTEDSIQFTVNSLSGYRQVKQEPVKLSREKTLLISYEDMYPFGFNGAMGDR